MSKELISQWYCKTCKKEVEAQYELLSCHIQDHDVVEVKTPELREKLGFKDLK